MPVYASPSLLATRKRKAQPQWNSAVQQIGGFTGEPNLGYQGGTYNGQPYEPGPASILSGGPPRNPGPVLLAEIEDTLRGGYGVPGSRLSNSADAAWMRTLQAQELQARRDRAGGLMQQASMATDRNRPVSGVGFGPYPSLQDYTRHAMAARDVAMQGDVPPDIGGWQGASRSPSEYRPSTWEMAANNAAGGNAALQRHLQRGAPSLDPNVRAQQQTQRQQAVTDIAYGKRMKLRPQAVSQLRMMQGGMGNEPSLLAIAMAGGNTELIDAIGQQQIAAGTNKTQQYVADQKLKGDEKQADAMIAVSGMRGGPLAYQKALAEWRTHDTTWLDGYNKAPNKPLYVANKPRLPQPNPAEFGVTGSSGPATAPGSPPSLQTPAPATRQTADAADAVGTAKPGERSIHFNPATGMYEEDPPPPFDWKTSGLNPGNWPTWGQIVGGALAARVAVSRPGRSVADWLTGGVVPGLRPRPAPSLTGGIGEPPNQPSTGPSPSAAATPTAEEILQAERQAAARAAASAGEGANVPPRAAPPAQTTAAPSLKATAAPTPGQGSLDDWLDERRYQTWMAEQKAAWTARMQAAPVQTTAGSLPETVSQHTYPGGAPSLSATTADEALARELAAAQQARSYVAMPSQVPYVGATTADEAIGARMAGEASYMPQPGAQLALKGTPVPRLTYNQAINLPPKTLPPEATPKSVNSLAELEQALKAAPNAALRGLGKGAKAVVKGATSRPAFIASIVLGDLLNQTAPTSADEYTRPEYVRRDSDQLVQKGFPRNSGETPEQHLIRIARIRQLQYQAQQERESQQQGGVLQFHNWLTGGE